MTPENVATPFEHVDPAILVTQCQRFWEQTYNHGVAAGSITDAGRLIATANGTAAFRSRFPWTFNTRKRTTPTITLYSPATGDSAKLEDETGAADVAAGSQGEENGANIYPTASVGGDTNILAVHAVADAEL